MLVVMHIYVGKVNRCPKENDSENIFEMFLQKKKKKMTFFIALYIFHESGKKFLKMVH